MYRLGNWSYCKWNKSEEEPWPEDFIDSDWNEVEKKTIVKYLESTSFKRGPSGIGHGKSKCRLCNHKFKDADHCYFDDGEYGWGSDFSHYIKSHGVKPEQAFIDHVLVGIMDKFEVKFELMDKFLKLKE